MAFHSGMSADERRREIEGRMTEARELEKQRWMDIRAREKRERDTRRAAAAKQKSGREEAVRVEAEAQLKAELREEFLAANAAATEQDFERLYPELRDRRMLERRAGVIAATRRNSRYNI